MSEAYSGKPYSFNLRKKLCDEMVKVFNICAPSKSQVDLRLALANEDRTKAPSKECLDTFGRLYKITRIN